MTDRGICWSTNQNPTIADSKTSDGIGTGSFTSSITGLNAETTYYVRAYAINSVGVNYGVQVAFSTKLPTLTTSSVSNIYASSASCGGNITYEGGSMITSRGVCWSTSPTPTIALNTKTSNGTGSGTFTSSISGLTVGTTYYVRAYATNSIGTAYGSEISFTTVLPSVTTSDISNITATTASCGGNVSDIGGAAVTSRGVCWSTSSTPTISNSKTSDGTGIGAFSSTITGLTVGTTYYARAYATNSIGTVYGTVISFSTKLATITTNTVSDLTSTTATCGGNVTSIGGTPVTACGVCWSITATPTISNSKTIDGSGLGSFVSSITGLTPETTYYVRAYATNSIGTAYGSQITISTSLPVITTSTVTAISANSAICGGSITLATGAGTVTARGICWSSNQNPTIADSKTSDGSGVGTFTSSIIGLNAETVYYVRAYATNGAGTAYGSQVSFSTKFPILTTSAISTITATTATCGGSITDIGGSDVTTRGVCWSTSTGPTTALSTKTTDGTGLGTFISSITGLSIGTTYYVRSYATNSIGTTYGNMITFSTNLPTLSTNDVSSITSTTATCGGNITDIGGSSVTAKGVCWGTVSNPTISLSTKTSNGTGSGLFTSSITGLTVGTTYYVRAYATNSIGTVYGSQVGFSTILPTVTTSAISSITASTAVCGGNVTAIGGAPVTACGICWSTSTNPTISNSKTTDGSGAGVFTSSITGLTVGNTYYVRAYATNNIGTTYGSVVSFSTTLPTITTTSISNILATTASSGGAITAIGGSDVIARGVCWGISATPTINDNRTTDGSGVGTFTSSMSGLISDSTYYVRAYATNSIGTSYGVARSFKTVVVDIDGNIYHTVKIGTQVWMVENLKTTKYRNGTAIPIITNTTTWHSLTSGAYNDYGFSTSDVLTYGHRYNWFAVNDSKMLAPIGWHIPTDAEWITLKSYVSDAGIVGGLKEAGTTHWITPNTGATNSTGFTALPGGVSFGVNTIGYYGYYWSSTEYDDISQAYFTTFDYKELYAGRSYYSKDTGLSVRCIKD